MREYGVHDPTIIVSGKEYYLFSTDTQQPTTQGIPIRKSTDLVNWTFLHTALLELPEEAKSWSQAKGLWAPDVCKVKDGYRMYYSASTVGSTTSLIGLATATEVTGPWIDQGSVVRTNPLLCEHNAIDAQIVEDRQGNQWMVYGSFFGGLYIVSLDKKTGKRSDEQDYGQRIAIRSQSVDGAIEGPFIYYHQATDYFYLFVSFDSLNDTYHLRVGRSKEITGPYMDQEGHCFDDLNHPPSEVGMKLLGSYQLAEQEKIYAPGHNSLFLDVHGNLKTAHHAREVVHSDKFFLSIRTILWLEDGWPVVTLFPESRLDSTRKIREKDLLGDWEIVQFTDDSDLIVSQKVKISSEDIVHCHHNEYELKNQKKGLLYYQETAEEQWVLCTSGYDSKGNGYLGIKTVETE